MKPSVQSLLNFIAASPTPFHAVANTSHLLQQHGFKLLEEADSWSELDPGKYFVTRNDSSLVAWINDCADIANRGFRLVGAHTDSPCLRLKPNAIDSSHGYVRLTPEVYGGALLNPWFDRDLSSAGRVSYLDSARQIRHVLIDFKRALAFIPSLAIHLDRDANQKRSINRQKHLPALLTLTAPEKLDFGALLRDQIRQEHALEAEQILSFELSLYDCQAPGLVGLRHEFIASARIDNLLSCHAGLRAMVEAEHAGCSVLVLNDHEEVGSASAAGAQGPFLLSVLRRLAPDQETLQRAISRSLLISADNAHGVHPNYADKHEKGSVRQQ